MKTKRKTTPLSLLLITAMLLTACNGNKATEVNNNPVDPNTTTTTTANTAITSTITSATSTPTNAKTDKTSATAKTSATSPVSTPISTKKPTPTPTTAKAKPKTTPPPVYTSPPKTTPPATTPPPAVIPNKPVVGLNVDTPTPSEINAFLANHPISYNVSYTVEPKATAPYSAGVLSDKAFQSALNAVNFERFICGIPANVTLNDEYSKQIAAGSVILDALDDLTHTPSKPADMSEDFYDLGYSGTSSSNISMGRSSPAGAVIYGFMADTSSSSNLATVGHRRWIINPPMQQTGFGMSGRYCGMYTFDNSWGDFDRSKYETVAFPPQNMPSEYFGKDFPWSFSLSWSYTVEYSQITVKMTNLRNGAVWTSKNTGGNSYFTVNNDGYGQPNCIIWRQDGISCNPGDAYSVEISGIKKDGKDYPVYYNVSFF